MYDLGFLGARLLCCSWCRQVQGAVGGKGRRQGSHFCKARVVHHAGRQLGATRLSAFSKMYSIQLAEVPQALRFTWKTQQPLCASVKWRC